MMMIGDPPRLNPTVQIPDYDYADLEDPMAASPISYYNNTSRYEKVLPSNFDFPVDAYSCMYELKVTRCARSRSHDWTECPFAHPGEKARRRDPRRYHYSGVACPEFRKAGGCKRGDACEFSHGVFECWLHPSRYRTQSCKYGALCKRRVCFFAHTPEQLRASPVGSVSRVESMRSLKKNMGFGTGLGTLSIRYGSPRSPTLPSTPVRAISNLSYEEEEEEEEPVMERVESGRMLREKIYAKLEKENSLERVGPSNSDPDVRWVSELLM